MRNAAFVFSWLFFIMHCLMLVSIGIFSVTLLFSKDGQEALVPTFLMFALPMIVLGVIHHLASRLIIPRPVFAGIVEIIPAVLFFALTLVSGSPVFLTLAMPHLLVGSMSLLSAEEKFGEVVTAKEPAESF